MNMYYLDYLFMYIYTHTCCCSFLHFYTRLSGIRSYWYQCLKPGPAMQGARSGRLPSEKLVVSGCLEMGNQICSESRAVGKHGFTGVYVGHVELQVGIITGAELVPPLFVFAFLGSPLFSTNQAKRIFCCWGPNSSLDHRSRM